MMTTKRTPAEARAYLVAKGVRVVCISTYDADLAALDAKVAELRAAGHRRATRSSLIRAAVDAFVVCWYRGGQLQRRSHQPRSRSRRSKHRTNP